MTKTTKKIIVLLISSALAIFFIFFYSACPAESIKATVFITPSPTPAQELLPLPQNSAPVVTPTPTPSRVTVPNAKRAKVESQCAQFIAGFEGFRSKPYPDPSGRGCVVGFGQYSTCNGPAVTREKSMKHLQKTCKTLISKIEKRFNDEQLSIKLNNEQLVALASFAYNTPKNNPVFLDYDFYHAVQWGDRDGMYEVMIDYAPLRGNVIRRNKELELFFSSL
ncbi:MAG: hypothetical protein WCJ84_00510 [Candidatus Peregrinibacteria bacterium]